MTDISGKAAVVTGGGSGIGMGLAKELAKQGASVAIADIILENAQKVADEINATAARPWRSMRRLRPRFDQADEGAKRTRRSARSSWSSPTPARPRSTR